MVHVTVKRDADQHEIKCKRVGSVVRNRVAVSEWQWSGVQRTTKISMPDAVFVILSTRAAGF
jgi:hypothetical protein